MVEEEEIPYEWPANHSVPTDVLQLWAEVEHGLEKSQTGACVTITMKEGRREGMRERMNWLGLGLRNRRRKTQVIIGRQNEFIIYFFFKSHPLSAGVSHF